MKLIIQIPCLNEEQTLPITIGDLPKAIDGIDEIELLVINDGSDDRTVEVARELGVQHIINMPARKGLANAFRNGLHRALERGADIIVNTDGDNQYCGEDIAKLVTPIVNHEAEMVVGARNITSIQHFSRLKKLLQLMGSYVVRRLSKTDVQDATSGFRAFSREAALKLNVFSTYTYTLETLIQAGRKNITTISVPIRTNAKLRESRLMKHMFSYIARSAIDVLRIYLMYEPLRTFMWVGGIVSIPGFILVFRFLFAYITRPYAGHIQSLIIGSVFISSAFGIVLLGLLGDILAKNRMLAEDILYRLRDR